MATHRSLIAGLVVAVASSIPLTFAGSDLTSGPFVQCLACHSARTGEPHATGPNLFGVYGRHIASAEGFLYSRALKKHTGTWTEAELQTWLESPQTYAPGTTMAFSGIEDRAARQEVIEILKALR